MSGQLLGFHILGIMGLIFRVTAFKTTGQNVTFNVTSDIIRAISTDDVRPDTIINGDVKAQHEQSASSKSPFYPDLAQGSFTPAWNPKLHSFPFAVPHSKDQAAIQMSSNADDKSTHRRSSSDLHASFLKKTPFSQTSKLSTFSNSTSAVLVSIPAPSSTNMTSAASTKAQPQNQAIPVWLFTHQRVKMTAKLPERHVTETMFSQETKAVTTNIALFSGSPASTADVTQDKKMTKSWTEEQAAKSSITPPEIHTAPTIINTGGNTAATLIAKDKATPSTGPILGQKSSTSVAPTVDNSPTNDIRHIPTREMATLEVTDVSSSDTLASSVMTYAPSDTALNPSLKTPRSSRETRSPLSETHTHPTEARTSTAEVLSRTTLTLSSKSTSAPYIDTVTPVSETVTESNAPMTSANLSLSETQTMTSSPTHETLTMTEEMMTYATEAEATTDGITHPLTDANADQNRITDNTEKKKDITTDGSTDKTAKHSTDKDTPEKKQTTSDDEITSTATNPTENAVTSTASIRTTDCVEAIKVEGLRIVTVGQTTATLTWRYLTSGLRSSVKGVFHVEVKDRKGANACRLYTLEDTSDFPSPGLVGRQPRKRESCLQMPEKLIPDNGTVVIRDLKVCTDYDVTVTSECGDTCPCKEPDISGKASFTTLSSVPGPVESVRVKLNDSDSARTEVTWQPPDYPTCGIQGYVLLLLKEGECVRQIRFQAKGGELKDIDTDEGNEGNLCKDSVTVYGSLTAPQIVLSRLSPDTEYTLNVTAINDVGMGLPASRPVHTAIIVPSTPTQLCVNQVTSHSVTLEWRPPRPRPGPTTYTVQVMDMGSPYQFPPRTIHTSSRYCATGYKKSSCLVDGLRPYWTYNFTLTAHTARGDSPPATTLTPLQLVTTEPSVPGDVENLRVRGAEDKVTEVNVTWDCPALKERNTRITGFLLRSLLQVVKGHMNQTTDVRHVSSQDCDVTHSVDLDVIPERRYFFEVLTLGEKFNATQWTAISYFVPPGLSEAVTSLSVNVVGADNVTVWWSTPVVTNGQLRGYGVKVVDSDQTCIRWTLVPLEKTAFGKITNLQSRAIAAKCATRGSGDIVTVDPENQSVTLTLNDLPPDTSLTLIVYPKNDAGWGQPANVSVHTRETAPTAPTHISVKKTNATTLTVGWKPPQPRPGATNYSVVLHRATELDPSSLTFLASTSVTVTGWTNTQAVLTDLWSGWRYSLTLTASTSSGSRTVQLSQPIEMPQSPPGQVQNTSAHRVANDYRHVRVTWDYPLLRDMNGIIVDFTICCQRVASGREHCLTVKKACLPSSPSFCATFDVIPGHNYSLKVQANNEYSGVPFVASYSAKIGPPPALSSVPVTSSVSMGDSQSTFRVTFCAPCLLNDTNGDITFIALLVCREPYCEKVNTTALTSRVFIESLPSWKAAKGDNFQSLYRPTGDAWIGAVQTLQAGGARHVAKRSEEEVYTVGEEEECESRDVDVYCNGPVPAGQTFRVMAVACTSVSCAASDFSPSALTATAAGGPGVVTLSVVGSVLGLAVGLAVVVVLVIGYRRRQGRKSKRGGRGTTDDGIEMAATSVRHRVVTIQDYGDQLQEWKAVTHPESGLPVALVQQFAEIRQMCPQHSQSAAILQENKLKNRYTNILPYDHSRVKLVAMDDDVTTDYINANYIPGYHSKREYIATQGPLESTVDDFWRMVWEQRCPVIVMLSALTEGRLNKVYKYYPDQDQLHQPVSYGMVTVTLQNVQPQKDFLVRTFRLHVGRGPHHEVQQFFVDSWRDFKANLTPSLVLDFVRAVRREAPGPQKHPLLVHCSAGVGRTGTWIAIDYFMHYIRHSPPSAPLHIRDFVLAMRNCRAHMVQSVEQYVFLHEVVGELVRRKTEVDRYDEPAYSNQRVYANMAYEQDSEEAASNSNGSSSISSRSNNNDNNPQADTSTSSPNNTRRPPPSPPPQSKVLTSRM